MIAAVIDTSALLRMFIPDGPVPVDAEKAWRAAENGNALLLAPDLILVEATQVLYKKWRVQLLSDLEYNGVLEAVLAMPVELLGHRPFIVRAAELARAHAITVYDALYLAVADQYGAILLTVDQKMSKVAGEMGLRTEVKG